MSLCRQTKNINMEKIYISKLKIVAVFPIRNNLVRSSIGMRDIFLLDINDTKNMHSVGIYTYKYSLKKKNRMKKID
jgi:hypothetical protein